MTPDEIRELRCDCGHEAAHFCHDAVGCLDCDCPKDAFAALASALTERLAQAWDEGVVFAWDDPECYDREHNPYRSHADSGRSTGALSDGQGSARVVGRGEGSLG